MSYTGSLTKKEPNGMNCERSNPEKTFAILPCIKSRYVCRIWHYTSDGRFDSGQYKYSNLYKRKKNKLILYFQSQVKCTVYAVGTPVGSEKLRM